MPKYEIVTIDGKRYRKLRSLWNENFDWDCPVIDICDADKWVMIDGIENEELDQKKKGDSYGKEPTNSEEAKQSRTEKEKSNGTYH